MISKCYVWRWLPHSASPVVAGELHFDAQGRQTFAYGRSYLEREDAEPIYPVELALRRGTQEPVSGLDHFSCLRDAAPDAWGRRVIHARLLGRAEVDYSGDLTEADYLMHSGSDRIGALDFQESATDYIPREQDSASLEDLQQVAELVSRDAPIPPDLEAALFHGSSIGGARPKAAITGDGVKYVAKFSVSTDTFDMVRAEFVAMTLAARAGLDVASVTLEQANHRQVLLVERFDRKRRGDRWYRRALVSVLTVLGLDESWAREASYPNLADRIRVSGRHFKRDACELFSRMVFNVLIGNTDDHARNHAFFVQGETIQLTPAYDICPFPRAGGEASHSMKLFGNSNLSRIESCVQAAGEFGLAEDEALAIIESLIGVVAGQFDDICTEIGMPLTTRNLLWGRAILNPDIFSGRFDFLNPTEG